MDEIDTIITYTLQYMKEKKVNNFVLVSVDKLRSQNSYEFCGKFPDKEIAHMVGIENAPKDLKLIAKKGVDALQEWFVHALDNPRLLEKEQKWIEKGKPLVWPVSEKIKRAQDKQCR